MSFQSRISALLQRSPLSLAASLRVLAGVTIVSVSYGAYRIHASENGATLPSIAEFASTLSSDSARILAEGTLSSSRRAASERYSQISAGAAVSLGCDLSGTASPCKHEVTQFKTADFAEEFGWLEDGFLTAARESRYNVASIDDGSTRSRRLSRMIAVGGATSAVALVSNGRTGRGAAGLTRSAARSGPGNASFSAGVGSVRGASRPSDNAFLNSASSDRGRSAAADSRSSCSGLRSCDAAGALSSSASGSSLDAAVVDNPSASSATDLDSPTSVATTSSAIPPNSVDVNNSAPGDLARVSPTGNTWVAPDPILDPFVTPSPAGLRPIVPVLFSRVALTGMSCGMSNGIPIPCVSALDQPVPEIVTPEPATVALVLMGLCAMAVMARRRQS